MRTYLRGAHTALLNVKVRPEEKRALQAEAERQGVSVSTLGRQALQLDEPLKHR